MDGWMAAGCLAPIYCTPSRPCNLCAVPFIFSRHPIGLGRGQCPMHGRAKRMQTGCKGSLVKARHMQQQNMAAHRGLSTVGRQPSHSWPVAQWPSCPSRGRSQDALRRRLLQWPRVWSCLLRFRRRAHQRLMLPKPFARSTVHVRRPRLDSRVWTEGPESRDPWPCRSADDAGTQGGAEFIREMQITGQWDLSKCPVADRRNTWSRLIKTPAGTADSQQSEHGFSNRLQTARC